MDEYPPTPRLQSPEATADGGQAKKNRLHALAFLEVGLFEFFFVAVVLILVFGTLNYFNILPISQVFPNQLSWLPRQQTPQTQSPNPSPTSIQMITEQQARKGLEQVISSSINPAYSPSQLKVFNLTSNSSGKVETFVGSWQTNDGVFIQIFSSYEENLLVSNTRKIFIGIPEGMVESLDSTNSATLTNRYLSFKIQAIPTCIKANSKFPKLILCEANWTNVNGVRFDLQIMHPFEKFNQ